MSLLDELTPKQRRFVEHYTGPDRGNAIQSAKKAGYGAGMASELMRNEKVLAAIEEENEKQRRTLFFQEQDILERLWIEATREGKGSNHNGRIQALVYLGKHIGMWEDKSKALIEAEKKGGGNITYNVINFSEARKQELENKVIHAIEDNKEEVEKSKDNILDGIIITEYENKGRG